MKKSNRNPEKFEVIDLFSSIGQYRDFKLNDEESIRAFLDSISLSLHNNSTPTMLYGRHVESMFGYMIASLGKCTVVKKEDDGDIFLENDTMKIPDYRLITKTGKILLVEVKNFNTDKKNEPFKKNKTYFNKLQRYAKENNVDLKIAIYWSHMNIWTLLSPKILKRKDEKIFILFTDALKYNELSTLGDILIGTTPPLSIKIYADKNSSRKIEEDGNIKFRIGNVEVKCKEQMIVDKEERQIAVFLMMFGNWKEKSIAINSNELLEYIEFTYEPEFIYETKNCGYDYIGFMSSIISNQYKSLTLQNGVIEKIMPKINTGMLGFIIPTDYHGKQLPLWRFHLEPQNKK